MAGERATTATRRALIASTLILVCGGVLPAATHAQSATQTPATAPALDGAAATPAPRAKLRRLSDERNLSRWAHPANIADIYARHSGSSKVVGRLRIFTEDGFPEVYLLLEEWTSPDGKEWVHIRIPKRPNGRKGWVSREALGPYNIVRTQLVVNRTTLRATLFKRGRKIWSARVGVGAASTQTPAGKFWIREKFRFKNTPVYGTHALGTAAYAPTLTDWPNGGVVGLHGTNQPGLIPGRPSHGCIRVRNENIARLYRLIPLGTPLLIR